MICAAFIRRMFQHGIEIWHRDQRDAVREIDHAHSSAKSPLRQPLSFDCTAAQTPAPAKAPSACPSTPR
jgi:hypothetical protein